MAKARAPTSQKNPAWVVTVGAMKGGAGKTMVVDNIAGCLAERYKVLVVDADPQANASKGLGIDIADPDMTTLADVLTNQGTPPEDAVIRAPLRDLPNLDVMPSSILLFKTEFELAAKGERIRLLGYYLQDNSEFFGRYDYIIIDTNPGLGLVNQNAFFAADSIVLVTDVSDNGLTGVEMFQYLWGEELCTELRIPDVTKGLVVCNYDKRIKLAPEMLDYIRSREDMGGLLVDTVIPYRVAYKDTEVESKPINLEHPKSNEHTILEAVVKDLRKKGAI